MLEKLLRDLEVNGQKTSITIKKVDGDVNNKTTMVEGLKVSSRRDADSQWIQFAKPFTNGYLPVDQDDIAAPSKLKQWKYLESIIHKTSLTDDTIVGLLIGGNCTKALEPLNIIPNCTNGPYELQRRLGWCVVAPVNKVNQKRISYGLVTGEVSYTNGFRRRHFQAKTDLRETGINEMLNKMYNEEFAKVHFTRSKKKIEMLQDDTRYMEIVDEGAKLKIGHYQISLLLKQEDVRLPYNKYQATQILSYLKRKFNKNQKFKVDYIKFMEDIIANGYAMKSTMAAAPGKT